MTDEDSVTLDLMIKCLSFLIIVAAVVSIFVGVTSFMDWRLEYRMKAACLESRDPADCLRLQNYSLELRNRK
jgi:hypothetical protein